MRRVPLRLPRIGRVPRVASQDGTGWTWTRSNPTALHAKLALSGEAGGWFGLPNRRVPRRSYVVPWLILVRIRSAQFPVKLAMELFRPPLSIAIISTSAYNEGPQV